MRFDRPAKRLEDLREVCAHRRFGGVAVAGSERVDDGFVLAE
jgi:hypothetical protein